MSGCPATRGRDFKILDMGFWLHELDPVFTLQVDDHPAFVIAKRKAENKAGVALKDAKGFTVQALSGVVPFASFGSAELDLGAWGLYDQIANLETTLEEFYSEVYRFAQTNISGVEPDATERE